VTDVEVIIENVLPEIRKMFPLAFGLNETFYEPLAKHFQRRPRRQSLFVYCSVYNAPTGFYRVTEWGHQSPQGALQIC